MTSVSRSQELLAQAQLDAAPKTRRLANRLAAASFTVLALCLFVYYLPEVQLFVDQLQAGFAALSAQVVLAVTAVFAAAGAVILQGYEALAHVATVIGH